jgi:hypothetical protein
MNIISHRGNINGPLPEKENRPSYIDCAIQLGYEVEVDIRYINNEFWLGHDKPQFKVEISWMKIRKNDIWYHCKDKLSSIKLLELNDGYKFFCHKSDDYVLTSTGHIWVHDIDSEINDKCIIPLISEYDILNYKDLNPAFICTDFVTKINF